MLKVWILWVLLVTGINTPFGYITPGWMIWDAYQTLEECAADARAKYVETMRVCVQSPAPDGPLSVGDAVKL